MEPAVAPAYVSPDADPDDWPDAMPLLEAVAGIGSQIITFAYPDLRPLIALGGVQVPPEWRPYFTRMETTNTVVRRVGERYGAFLLDFERHPSASDPDHMSSDLIHPNALGYRAAGADALRLLSEHFDLPGAPA